MLLILQFFVGGLISEQVAVEAGDTSPLGGLLEAFNLRLILIFDFCRGDLVDLMKTADSALDDFNQDERLNDGVACSTDVQIFGLRLGKHSQRIAEVLLNLAL